MHLLPVLAQLRVLASAPIVPLVHPIVGPEDRESATRFARAVPGQSASVVLSAGRPDGDGGGKGRGLIACQDNVRHLAWVQLHTLSEPTEAIVIERTSLEKGGLDD